MLPVPSLRVPFQPAVALVVGILDSFRRVGNAILSILTGNRAAWAATRTGWASRDPGVAGSTRAGHVLGGRLRQRTGHAGASILSCQTHPPTQPRPVPSPSS